MSRNVSECIQIPFHSISLGGCRDANVLNGMDYCYVGSHPGAIARALKSMGCANGLLYLDEIDKIGSTSRSEEVSASFLSILDESQNTSFEDNYLFDLKLNLSKLFIIGSVNDANKIDPILRNRMKIIKLPSPTEKDKIEIVKNHFIPKYMKEYGIKEGEIIFSEDIIKYLILKTTKEPGVRELKRNTEHIISRFNLLRKTHIKRRSKKRKVDDSKELKFSFSIPDFCVPLELDEGIVDKFMAKSKQEDMNMSVQRMYM